jgi:hypothetical protein
VVRLKYEPSQTMDEKVEWQNKLVALVEKNIPFTTLLNTFGRENLFFQVRVNGFRTKDENGDREYTSDSVGTGNVQDTDSIFSRFSKTSRILSSEVRATYLSEGYQ